MSNIFAKSLWCHTLSKALVKSRMMAAVRFFLLNEIASSSKISVSWIDVECSVLNANYFGLMQWPAAFFSLDKVVVSNKLDREFSSDIGR